MSISLIIKTLGLVRDFADAKEWFGKRWFLSKTLGVNALAILAMWLQSQYGFIIDAEGQAEASIRLGNLNGRQILKKT